MNKSIITLIMAIFMVLSGFFVSLAQAGEKIKRVENELVCMVNDTHFGRKQIPVNHNGKTYFGCCENCKATLASDQRARTGIDPVTKKVVDKASAVIGAKEDSTVLYFESEKTFKQYQQQTLK